MTQKTIGLTEKAVRDRLKLCTDKAVLGELYALGQTMLAETVARFRVLDLRRWQHSAGIITLLVSASAAWLPAPR